MLAFKSPIINASFNVACLSLVIWVLAWLYSFSSLALGQYQFTLGSIPSYNFVDRIADAKLACSNGGIAIVGPSTVREGFDPERMAELTGRCTVNAGVTSKGSITHTEMQLDLMLNFGIRAEVLVLGINSRMLVHRANPITQTRYFDFLTADQVEYYLPYEYEANKPSLAGESFLNEIWPANRHSIRLDYLIRYGLMKLNRFIGGWNDLSREDFSRGADVLYHPPAFLYSDVRFNQQAFDKQIEGTKKMGLFNKQRYSLVPQLHGLHRVAEKAQMVADQVVVVVMPEHSFIRGEFGSYADYGFHKILSSYESSQFLVYDTSEAISDKYIRDMAHLVADGRVQLTELVAKRIMDFKK